MRPSAGHRQLDDGSATTPAGLPRPPVDGGQVEVATAIAPRVHVVPHRGASPGHPFGKYSHDPVTQGVDGGAADHSAPSLWMEAGMPESLVGVDVSNAGHHALVEQGRLEPQPGVAPQAGAQSVDVETLAEGLGAHAGEQRVVRYVGRWEDNHATEFPLVVEEKPGPVIEIEDDSRRRGFWR
jgi:hypothetical protein